MDKNTPLSSFPSSEHEMDPNGKIPAKKKVESNFTEPSVQIIKNILNYSKTLNIMPSKSVIEFVEYITN